MLIGFIFHTPELRMNRLLHRRLPPFGKQEGVKEKGKKSKKVKPSAFKLECHQRVLPFYFFTVLPFKYYRFTFKYYFFSCNFFALISASR